MKLEYLTVSQEGIDWQKCLQHWAWILKKSPEFNILLVTKFGELFVVNDLGEIWFLSTSNASYEKVAESREDLSNILSVEENIEYYFMPKVLALLENAGMNLSPKECYGFHVPCVFKECVFEVGNFKCIKVEKYLIGLGDLLGELQGTKNGESVEFTPAV